MSFYIDLLLRMGSFDFLQLREVECLFKLHCPLDLMANATDFLATTEKLLEINRTRELEFFLFEFSTSISDDPQIQASALHFCHKSLQETSKE